ncbi:hypothetical protein PVAND_013925 [Polypedilum vanderplanki]|uniref:Endonuclease/exonuclease/phosphatase domain-containing protein n=1 Tax=Polypedilum vanderplanki TaxID=319348 RepID=A0A9J6CS74_POLVA|nr:hypothetical protein PVAND_013925 [Polypedilum vanderplanki]
MTSNRIIFLYLAILSVTIAIVNSTKVIYVYRGPDLSTKTGGIIIVPDKVRYNRLTIINIYNNPSSSLDLLKETLLEDKDYIDESENILILGDFNHELKLGSPLESFMLQSFDTRLFSPRESTTNARTVIDGVFGRIEDYNVEVFIYESYASHQQPISHPST